MHHLLSGRLRVSRFFGTDVRHTSWKIRKHPARVNSLSSPNECLCAILRLHIKYRGLAARGGTLTKSSIFHALGSLSKSGERKTAKPRPRACFPAFYSTFWAFPSRAARRCIHLSPKQKAWARTDGEHGFSTSFGLIEYPGTTKTHAAAGLCRKYRCGCERCNFHFASLPLSARC